MRYRPDFLCQPSKTFDLSVKPESPLIFDNTLHTRQVWALPLFDSPTSLPCHSEISGERHSRILQPVSRYLPHVQVNRQLPRSGNRRANGIDHIQVCARREANGPVGPLAFSLDCVQCSVTHSLALEPMGEELQSAKQGVLFRIHFAPYLLIFPMEIRPTVVS